MHGFQKFPTNILILSTLLCLNGCIAPFIIGGAAAGAAIATREKGIGGTMSDSNIATKVRMNLYNFNADLHAKISVSVQNQEVLLTGVVQDASWSQEAERLAKSVNDVKNVINNIETEDEEGLGSMTSDSWITTRVRSSLLFEKDLYSLNYTVETVNGVVYLTGVGQDETEINRVAEVARNVGGVKKVVNHVKIKGQETAPDSEEATAPVENTSVEVAPIDQSSTIPEVEDRG
jgi:osmotically-inducible protein OsmY